MATGCGDRTELQRRLIFDCWANRARKATHGVARRYQRFAARNPYALKMDIRNCFPSLDREILKAQLRGAFKEQRLLSLLDTIVDATDAPEREVEYFPGDTLFTLFERRRGLPIGNLTWQLWANTYLSDLDHWVRQQFGASDYLRFVDDFLVLGRSRAELMERLGGIAEFPLTLRLRLHERKCVVRRTEEGVPFLAYVVWPDRIRVRGPTVRRFRRRYRHVVQRDPCAAADSLTAWQGHVALAGTWRRCVV